MVIILKIFLSILSIALGYISYFVIKEFRKFKKSTQSEDSSLLEKFMIGAVAFSCVALLVILSAFCLLMVFSSITITLPF